MRERDTERKDSGLFFCFQAEDGIRDYKVTGVQTCALPICLGAGPGARDLIFNPGGDQSVATLQANWTRVAYTLKARYYMHTAESLGVPAYTAAIAAALNGIGDPTGEGDLRSFHTKVTAERNMWSQFQVSSGFGTDLEAGKTLVDYMNARNDPRRAAYFCLNALGGYGGGGLNRVVGPRPVSHLPGLAPPVAPGARGPVRWERGQV